MGRHTQLTIYARIIYKKFNPRSYHLRCVLDFAFTNLLLAEETKPAKIEEGAWYESILWTFVNGFFGLLVWIAGTLLNIAVGQFVVGFGDLFKSQGLGFAVDHLWGLVRDIF